MRSESRDKELLLPRNNKFSVAYDTQGSLYEKTWTDPHNDNENKGTWFGSIFTVMTCAVGSGVLSLPFAFKETGVGLGVILLFFISAITLYSLHLLIVCSEIRGEKTYQDVAYSAYGKVGTLATKIVLFTTLFGSMVGYLIIIGDLLSPVVCQLSHHSSNCNADIFYLNRDFLIFVVLITMIFPLSFFGKIHQLEKSSVLAVASVICVLVVVIWRSIQSFVNEGSEYRYPPFFNFSLVAIGQAAPIMSFALGCHVQIIPIYNELQYDIRTVRVMDRIMFSSNTFSTVLYLLIGGFAALHFKELTDGNILNNFAPSDIVATIGRLAMAFHVGLAFPLLVWPARNVLDDMIFSTEYTRGKTLRFVVETTLLICLTFGIAIVIPNITIVFGYTGAICSTMANFLFPAAFYLKIVKYPSFWSQKLPCILLIFIGAVIGIVSTVMITYNLIKTHH